RASPRAGHPMRDRLSNREHTLDQDLMDLGISPHPRVVLAVEGETEQAHVPLVWRELDYRDAPELMRLFMLGGVNKNLETVAALAVAPLVGPKIHGGRPAWPLIKPPTCFQDQFQRRLNDPVCHRWSSSQTAAISLSVRAETETGSAST